MEARLIERKAVTPSVLELTFELPEPVDYEPGQFARVTIDGKTWRDYTMIDGTSRQLRFLVDARFGGAGSDFALNSPLGSIVDMTVPKGKFVLHPTPMDKVFIATGTGLAPFITMAQAALQQFSNTLVDVLFGCRTRDDDLASLYLPGKDTDRLQVDVCLSDDPARDERYWQGYVTDLLAERHYPPDKTEFYVCGNRQMVEDVCQMLQRRGIQRIFSEPF
ncbi:FAD-dependent oxidoreductase [Marinobacteraceae bacterium S3BR75-40.1]